MLISRRRRTGRGSSSRCVCVCVCVAACCSLCSAKSANEQNLCCVFVCVWYVRVLCVDTHTGRGAQVGIQFHRQGGSAADTDLQRPRPRPGTYFSCFTTLLAVEARGASRRAVFAQIDLSTVFQKTSNPLHKNNLIYQRPCRGAGE